MQSSSSSSRTRSQLPVTRLIEDLLRERPPARVVGVVVGGVEMDPSPFGHADLSVAELVQRPCRVELEWREDEVGDVLRAQPGEGQGAQHHLVGRALQVSVRRGVQIAHRGEVPAGDRVVVGR